MHTRMWRATRRAAGTVSAALVALALLGATSATPALAADGTGTMTVSPTYVVSGSNGNFLTFTYTAGAGGMNNGTLTLLVPTGWTTPSVSGFDNGGLSIPCAGSNVTISPVGAGNLVTIPGLSLSAGQTCTIRYGISGFNGGDTAPSTVGTNTFTTQEASTSSGSPTTLTSGSPQVVVGNDGTGTMTVSPAAAVVSSTGNTLTFTYKAARTISNGELTVAVPSGWSTPSTSASAPGATAATCGTVGVAASAIQITGMNLANGSTCTVTYGNKAGGPGATAPAAGGPLTFTTQQESTNDNNLVALPTSPQVTVSALDGKGTMTVSPTSAITASTGNDLTFTYTAPTGGVHNGTLTLLVPAGWTTPSASGFDAGGLSAACAPNGPAVTSVAGGSLVTLSGITLEAGDTCTILYGIQSFNAGDTAPSTPGPYQFTTQEASTPTGTLHNLAASPVITVGNDGTGTMTVSPNSATAGSSGNTLTFTYTATRAITGGELTVAVPAGWSAPSTSASAPGATTSTCGTIGVAGSTIQATGANLTSGSTCTVTYGNKAGGPGATSPTSGGAMTFTTQEKSSSGGTLTTLGSGSPQVTVSAPDGTGTMTVSPSSVLPGSTGNDFTFTYTAPAAGLNNGTLTLLVPTGWTTPSTNPSSPGGVSVPCAPNGFTVSSVTGGSLITIPGVSLSGGDTCNILYGLSFFNSGVTAPSSTGAFVFKTQEKSTTGGTLTNIGSSPAVTVNQDGAGTMTVAPSAESAGATGKTLTFTYTAAAGVPLGSGEVTLAVPAGWSAPSATPTDPGYTTTTCANGAVTAPGPGGRTISVSGISLAGGSSCTITYGDANHGGPGATIASTLGDATFTSQEKSSGLGSLTPLPASPHLKVFGTDGSGTLTVAPAVVGSGSGGNTLSFKYTAAAGGLSDGQIRLAVPAGWSAPATTGGLAGFTSTTCGGGVAIVSGVIQVNGVVLPAGGTCTIIYGDRSGGGSGASAPSNAGLTTFAAQESSTGGDQPVSLASSPQIDLTSADGAGTMTVSPSSVATGSSANTLTFTYTAGAGGTSGGEITVAVPAGWSVPSTGVGAPGYTTAGCGTLGTSGQTIQLTGVTLPAGGTCAIVFGSQAAGGPGAGAPSADTTSTFTTDEMSTGAGSLTPVASSPSVQVSTFPALSVTMNGSGTVSGGGIACPGTCSQHYAPGTPVSLTASPAPGFVFSGWNGACTGTGPCEVTMSSSQNVSATFTASISAQGSTAPACTLKTVGNKVHKPKGKHHGPDTLSLLARCTQPATITLSGRITELLPAKSKHGKPRRKVFRLKAIHAPLAGGRAKTLVVQLPPAAQQALLRGARESAAFTLLAIGTSNGATGTGHSAATLSALKR